MGADEANVDTFIRMHSSRVSLSELYRQCFIAWPFPAFEKWLSDRCALYSRAWDDSADDFMITKPLASTQPPSSFKKQVPTKTRPSKAVRRRLRMEAWMKVLAGDVLYNDKASVTVTRLSPDNPAVSPGSVVTRTLVVSNQGPLPRVLRAFIQARVLPQVTLADDNGCSGTKLMRPLAPGETWSLLIRTHMACVGRVDSLLVLEFDGFAIGRMLVERFEMLDIEVPSATSPYVKPQPKVRPVQTQIVRGEKPIRSKPTWAFPPPPHEVPEWFRTLNGNNPFSGGPAPGRMAHSLPAHADHLTRLLFVEEVEHEVNVQRYNMFDAQLKGGNGGLLGLEVPGLAENRPSVMRGDALYVQRSDGTSGRKEYQGYVHAVHKEEVKLRFSVDFHKAHIDRLRYNVRFVIKRSSFIFMHEAVSLTAQGHVSVNLVLPRPREEMALFQRGMPLPAIPSILVWKNKILNAEQRQAVENIVAGVHAPAPYVVFGPPGTGKTSTIVEAMLQVLERGSKLGERACVLACAPSNSAADLLAEKLLEGGVPRSALRRVCAYQRPPLLAGRLRDVSNWDDTACAFELPTVKALTVPAIRVVVCTCLMAAKLTALGVPAQHITHFFVDEAGHAEEPLTLAAIAGLIHSGLGARLVLAGDPKQLGPLILSHAARRNGLETSMLERLLRSPPYIRRDINDGGPGLGQYDAYFITKLVKNWRSHPDILRLPNEMFYDGDLVACANPIITESMLRWEKLPSPGIPMVFVSVNGKDEREGNSPSWFNSLEVKLVGQWVMDLLDRRTNRLTAEDIGVITPYRKQVERIRALLNGKGCAAVKVGSVEEFQGQERKVIIISTVRSTTTWMDFDKKHHLGFVANPKRFNVALTRAKALVVVIGNPEVLQHDTNWAQLLNYIYINGGCTGMPMPAFFTDPPTGDDGGSSDSGDDSLTAALEHLSLVEPLNPAPLPDDAMLSAAETEGSAMRRIDG